MDDAISRQAVIKCLERGDTLSSIDHRLIDKIKRLPSVTQKPIECEDAISRILKRMWNCRGKHTTSIDKVAMEQIIHDELPPVTQKWIPVSERLPEFDVPVLVYQTYYKGNAVTIGRYHSDEEQGGYKYWQWIMYDSWFSYGIDHFGIICPNSDFVEAWMPLPKPYEPQERSDKE